MQPQRDEASISRRTCAPRSRCNRWRVCPACAAIRQAKIANVAERLGKLYPALIWTTLHPVTGGARGITLARAEWARKADPAGALWTVEQAPTSKNLHLNIIHPPISQVELDQSHRWQRVIEGSVRNVAAYISKPEQFPVREDGPARIFGTLGPLWQYLASGDQAPPVAALAIQHALDPQESLQRARIHAHIRGKPEPHTMAEYKAIASKYLPDLLKAGKISSPNNKGH